MNTILFIRQCPHCSSYFNIAYFRDCPVCGYSHMDLDSHDCPTCSLIRRERAITDDIIKINCSYAHDFMNTEDKRLNKYIEENKDIRDILAMSNCLPKKS